MRKSRVTVAAALAMTLAGSSGSASSPPATVGPTAEPTIVAASAMPSATPSVVVTTDLAYEPGNAFFGVEQLDVYAPAKAGKWPVVVFFHGSPPTNSKATWASSAYSLAEMGLVVFVPSWGHGIGGAPGYDALGATIAESACAVASARAHASEYGGDPTNMVVFGHSAGANEAAMIAFARPAPMAGCLGGTTLGTIDALVTWDGDWMMIDPTWDAVIAADPRVLDVYTPLHDIAAHKDQYVALLASEDPRPYSRDVSNPAAMTALFAPRDPTGSLRKQLAANGALNDGSFDVKELQQLFFSLLKAQGNPVSLTVLTGATHDALGATGADILYAAIKKAATRT